MKNRSMLVATLLFAVMFVSAVYGEQPYGLPTEVDHTPIAMGTRAEILADIPDIAPAGSIVLGSSTPSSPNIMSAAWDNPVPNAQVRELIWGGLDTMARNHDNVFFPNPIVMVGGEMPTRTYNDDGSLTIHFHIYTTNQFSDGRYITAHDYAGSVAFFSSQYWKAVVLTQSMPELANRSAWQAGEADTLTSVRIYDDANFSITIAREYLPFVWETPLWNSIAPFPLHALGIEAHDDGYGVFLTAEDGAVLTADAVYLAVNGRIEFALDYAGSETAQIIGGTGFRFNPTVSVGPYMWGGRELEIDALHVTANPYFPGTWDGHRPQIRDIFWRTPAPGTNLVDMLLIGEVDMILGQNAGWAVDHLLDFAVGGGTHTYVSYIRNGFGQIAFHVDHGPTQFQAVRQAIHRLIDRELFAYMFTHGRATIPHGPYSYAQWWVQEAYARGFEDMVIRYTHDPQEAIRLLAEDGWIYDAQGDLFEGPGRFGATMAMSNVRHKMIDGELVPLDIHWCTFYSSNLTTMLLEELLLPYMEYAGFWVTTTYTDQAIFHYVRSHYGSDAQDFHMFNLGITFATTWNPWISYNPDLFGISNPNFVNNRELFELAERMRFMSHLTEEGRDEWVEAWMELMVFLNAYVLSIPLHVDIFHDFVPILLRNWHNTSVWGFSAAIQRAYWAD